MKNCISCDSDSIILINAKCSDLFMAEYKGYEYDGYPLPLPISNGDSVEFSLCLNCGKVQDNFPFDDTEIINKIKENQ